MLRFPAGIRARFKAGQYLRVRMPTEIPGISRWPMRRARATAFGCISGAFPAGSFRNPVLASLQKGDKLNVEIPFGEFYLRTGSDRPMSASRRVPVSRRSSPSSRI